MFKWLFWLGLIGGGVFVGGQVIPVYYNNMKIQNIFEGVATNLSSQPQDLVEERINELFQVQTVDRSALPREFHKNLSIANENGKLQIGSEYHVTLWLLDRPTSVNPDDEYEEADVKGMDKLRIRARLDFDFAPYAETP